MLGEKIIIFTLLIVSSYSLTCPTYTCGNLASTGNCVEYNSTTQQYVLDPCSKYPNLYCQPTYQQNSTCTTISSTLSYPGEACKNNANCQSGTCSKSGYCVGFDADHPCENIALYGRNVQCNPGLYCDSSVVPAVCKNLAAVFEPCSEDDQCTYGSGCYNNACLDFSRILPGEPLLSDYCYSGYTSPYCSSGQCYQFANGTTICANAFSSALKFPVSCNDNTRCISKVDPLTHASISGTCVCAYTNIASSYCTPFLGDGYTLKYQTVLREWDRSIYISKCNIDIIYTPGCVLTYWSKVKIAEFLYYGVLGQNNAEVQMINIQQCATSIYYNSYDAAKSIYDKAFEKKSLSIILSISGLIILNLV